MNVADCLEASLFLQVLLSACALLALIRRRAHRVFPQVASLLCLQMLSVLLTLSILYFRSFGWLDGHTAFKVYFWAAWISGGLTFLLRVFVVWAVFAEAMRPMAGLHKAGKLIFRWVAVVSSLVAVALVVGPGVFSSLEATMNVLSRLQQGSCVLTLCLLVFVCFAVRPLGLTFRSHLFGVSLGLGLISMVELVEAAWLQTSGARSLYSPIYLFGSIGSCVAVAILAGYFAAPEPARRMILLPTTSPFFFWNRISEILGDAPGQVAVAGFTPDMLAPAEIEMLTAATANATVAPEEQSARFPRPVSPTALLRPELGLAPRPSLAL